MDHAFCLDLFPSPNEHHVAVGRHPFLREAMQGRKAAQFQSLKPSLLEGSLADSSRARVQCSAMGDNLTCSMNRTSPL